MPEPDEDGADSPEDASVTEPVSHGVLATLRRRWPEYVIEAFVIVISISLSFGLEAWRESRQTREREQIYLRTLADNLEADIDGLKEVIEQTKAVIHSSQVLAGMPAGATTVPAGFRENIGVMIRRPSFVAHDAAFANLRSAGGLQAIGDFPLKNALFNYYGDVESIRAAESAEREVLINVLGPFLMRGMRLHNNGETPASVAEAARLIGSTEFQNGMWIRVQNRQELLEKYEAALRDAERIAARIGKRIEK